MRIKQLLIACAIASVTVTAQAATIAGWDHSQWYQSGILSINGQQLTNVLNANYSSLDPTNNAGGESAALGRLFFDGQFGSSLVDPDPASATFIPVAGSLNSNLDAPVSGVGDNPFDSLGILRDEGQQYANLLSMAASAPISVVYMADLTSLGRVASDWTVTFGARAGSASPLFVDFSSNGVDYINVGQVSLGSADTPYQVGLSGEELRRAFVRFRFTPASDGAQFIDNVAIQGAVPEPATLGLLLAGLAGLAIKRVRCA